MNEFLIQLQAILDSEKSKGNISKSLTRIQNNLNKLKVQAEIDPKALLKITKQLQSALSNPKINISNIGFEANSNIKKAEEIGEKIGQTISKSTEKNINIDKLNADIKTLVNNLNNFSSKNEGFDKFKIEIDGVEVSLDSLINKLSTVDNTTDLSTIRSQANALKTTFTELAQINEIQLSIETGGYESKVESLISRTRQWTDENGNARISTDNLSAALQNLNTASNNLANNNTVANQQTLVSAEKELKVQIDSVTNSIRSMNAELAKDSAVSSLHNSIGDFMSKNGKAVRAFKVELNGMFNSTAQGSKLTNQELAKLKQQFLDLQIQARNTGKLGKTFFQTLREGMSSFSYWTSSTFLVMKSLQEIKEAISFAKELDSALVNINYTMDVTKSQLKDIGNQSIDMAKDLHTSAENVLGAVKLYANAKETAESILAKAQPAIMLSNVTGFSGEESAKYLQTIMNQFDLTQDNLMNISDIIQGVSQSMAHDFSDGIVQINEGISTSGEVARAAGMDLAEYASMIGLLVEKTGLAGSQLGNSLKTIITRTTKAGEILGIDEGEISAAETSLRSIGVEVRKTDGEFNEFNDTMRELAKQWDILSDVEKSNISFNLAGTRQINVIQTLLRNWSEYEELVNKANDSAGVTFENQEKYAKSLEGKIKGLSSTITSIGDNIFKSDDLSIIVNGLTKIAELFDIITNKTKFLGTIGLGAGLFAGVKNIGKPVRVYRFQISY